MWWADSSTLGRASQSVPGRLALSTSTTVARPSSRCDTETVGGSSLQVFHARIVSLSVYAMA